MFNQELYGNNYYQHLYSQHAFTFKHFFSLIGDQIHRKKQPYITLNSNPSKEKKSLAGLVYIQNPVNG